MEENEHIYSWPLPHLRVDAPFVQIPLIDENQKIKMWHPYNEKYILLPITDINSGLYFSLDKKNMNDSYIKFIDFIYQKIKLFNTSTIAKIERDILNLLISLSKIEFFLQDTKTTSDFIQTEIEYILITCRSLFDLLQIIIKFILSRFQFVNPIDQTSFRLTELKDSFSKMYKNMSKYKLPKYINDFYSDKYEFFIALKEMRDDIIHRGISMPTIFIFKNKGFAIDANNKTSKFVEFANKFQIWDVKSFEKNNLAPMLPVIAYIILNSINALSDFITIIENPQYFKGLPSDVAPNYKIYLRSPFAKYFNNLETIIKNNSWSF